MTPRQRIGVAAFFADFALYLVMVGLPFEALRRGAGAVALGAIPALYATAYSATAMVSGRASDRLARRRLARVGILLAAATALALGRAGGLAVLLALVAPLGLGLGLFWAPLQGTLGDLSGSGELEGLLGRFNTGWSSGKALGFVLGGLLLQQRGASGVAAVSCLALLAAGALFPAVSRPGDPPAAAAGRPAPEPPELPVRLRRFAWMTNGLAFALAATFNHHLPRLLVARGMGSAGFGLFLGLVFLCQTATFVILGRWHQFHGREGPLRLVLLVLASVSLAVPLAHRWSLLFAVAPLVGAGLGLAYTASLHGSLQSPRRRGRYAGIHESVLGLSSVVVPLAGGVLAHLSGWSLAPFALAGATLLMLGSLGGRWVTGRQRGEAS